MPHIFLAIAIIAEVVATSFLKLTDGFTRSGPALVTILGYSVSFYFLSLSLKTYPTGLAYAIWSGVGTVLITAIAWSVFGQRLDGAAIAGIALIVAGVLVIYTFSSASG